MSEPQAVISVFHIYYPIAWVRKDHAVSIGHNRQTLTTILKKTVPYWMHRDVTAATINSQAKADYIGRSFIKGVGVFNGFFEFMKDGLIRKWTSDRVLYF